MQLEQRVPDEDDGTIREDWKNVFQEVLKSPYNTLASGLVLRWAEV